ncbi:MAG: hypothetical protein A2W25_14005 [candidate division Zixibacteria bacterium RBG_16_53_22]|nr:MAG: hypothetical protein A2W25_14005 [candidate division Zixibacteria bacterium RBG_16_53_22]
MKDAVIGNLTVEFFELCWQEDLDSQGLADRFRTWLSDQTFIEQRLPDLRRATFCQLTIDPS